ncbi:MAG: pseudouridine synthase [Cyanobium sp.]
MEPLSVSSAKLPSATPPKPVLTTLLFNKPYGVLSQFTAEPGSDWATLAAFLNCPGVYPVGRLDADSEGLLLLTDNGPLQQRLLDPRRGHWRRYQVQVEGLAQPGPLEALRAGVLVQGRHTLPSRARRIEDPGWPERDPPIRRRLSIPTCWLELELREGRNRQVRRMTAAVGLPTLRLLRVAIDLMDDGPPLDLQGLAPGQWRPVTAAEVGRLEAIARGRRAAGAAAPASGPRRASLPLGPAGRRQGGRASRAALNSRSRA